MLLLASVVRPAVMAPVALVNAVMLDTVTGLEEVMVPVAETTGLMAVTDFPAMIIPLGAPVPPLAKLQLPTGQLDVVVVCVMINVVPGHVRGSVCALDVE